MKKVLAVILFSLLTICAVAQTGINIESGTSALAIHKNGGWAAADMSYLGVPVWASVPDTHGYINTVGVKADAFIPNSAVGFNYYGVGGELTPTKALASILSKSLIPSDSLRITLHGSVGSYVPAKGQMRATGLVGTAVSYALNNSGSIVWQVVEAGWMNPGTTYISSGLKFSFGGSTSAFSQSAKAAKMRRASMVQK